MQTTVWFLIALVNSVGEPRAPLATEERALQVYPSEVMCGDGNLSIGRNGFRANDTGYKLGEQSYIDFGRPIIGIFCKPVEVKSELKR